MANRDALNYERIYQSKEKHNKECDFPARRLLMHSVDIDRLDWTEGEPICGLELVADDNVGTGSFRIECDGMTGDGGEEQTETVEAVTPNRDLVHA